MKLTQGALNGPAMVVFSTLIGMIIVPGVLLVAPIGRREPRKALVGNDRFTHLNQVRDGCGSRTLHLALHVPP